MTANVKPTRAPTARASATPKKKRKPNPRPAPVQQRVLDLFHEADEARRPMPTYREIGDALGIASVNSVSDHVKALIRKGYIEAPETHIARGHVLTNKARRWRGVLRRQRAAAEATGADMMAPGMASGSTTTPGDSR